MQECGDWTMRNRSSAGRIAVAIVAGAALSLTLISVAQRGAAEELVNTGYFGDVAIKCYDPVAYFTQNEAVKGSEEFSYRWLGATWQFASSENRDLFAREPVKYAPQYGGLCADGVSFGTVTTNIDPQAWRIIEGKLYLAYDPGAADGLEKSATKVANSQKYWPEVRETLVSERQAHGWEE
jgi:YHS domain-containing protein